MSFKFMVIMEESSTLSPLNTSPTIVNPFLRGLGCKSHATGTSLCSKCTLHFSFCIEWEVVCANLCADTCRMYEMA